MIANNVSSDITNNKKVKRELAQKGEGNSAWLKRVIAKNNFGTSGLLLLGGNSAAEFHIRVAQSSLRLDLTPSYWSLVGVLSDLDTFYSVPLQWQGDLSAMHHENGIQTCKLSEYDNPVRFPNIAFLQFTTEIKRVIACIDKLRVRRGVVDLPELVVRWLEYVWAVGSDGNPLDHSKGLPSAVFAETVFGMGGIELTPGLASASSCPEAIWQAAKWWTGFYAETSKIKVASQADSMVPEGCFVMRQPAAAVYKRPSLPKVTKKAVSKKP